MISCTLLVMSINSFLFLVSSVMLSEIMQSVYFFLLLNIFLLLLVGDGVLF
jgi:hypothetical protein